MPLARQTPRERPVTKPTGHARQITNSSSQRTLHSDFLAPSTQTRPSYQTAKDQHVSRRTLRQHNLPPNPPLVPPHHPLHAHRPPQRLPLQETRPRRVGDKSVLLPLVRRLGRHPRERIPAPGQRKQHLQSDHGLRPSVAGAKLDAERQRGAQGFSTQQSESDE